MVQSCSVYNCVERYKSGSNISFHMYPKDLSLKNRWIVAMHRENFKPPKHARICSKHFSSDSFITGPWSSKKALKNDAVPSIFDFPSHLTKKGTVRKRPTTRYNSLNEVEQKYIPAHQVETSIKEENPSECSMELSVKKRRVFYIGDYKHLSTIDQQYRRTVSKLLTKRQKQIKILQQRNRRLTKKVTNLKSLLEHLKQLIDDDSLKVSVVSDSITTTAMEIVKQLLNSKLQK